jgi:hypothetical protein
MIHNQILKAIVSNPSRSEIPERTRPTIWFKWGFENEHFRFMPLIKQAMDGAAVYQRKSQKGEFAFYLHGVKASSPLTFSKGWANLFVST